MICIHYIINITKSKRKDSMENKFLESTFLKEKKARKDVSYRS